MAKTGILFLALTCALAGCVSDGPVSAQLAAGADDPTDEVATPVSPTDIVCRNERGTGTHMVKRVCYSRAELDAQSEASQEWLRSSGAKGGPRRVIDDADPRRK